MDFLQNYSSNLWTFQSGIAELMHYWYVYIISVEMKVILMNGIIQNGMLIYLRQLKVLNANWNFEFYSKNYWTGRRIWDIISKWFFLLLFSKNRNLSEKKRRDVFNKLIGELNSMVTKSSKKMDKSAVLQASIAYLRHFKGNQIISNKQPQWNDYFLIKI